MRLPRFVSAIIKYLNLNVNTMGLQSYLNKHAKKHLIFDFDKTIAWAKVDWDALHRERYEYLKHLDPEIILSDNNRAGYKRVNDFVAKHGREHYDELMENETSLELKYASGFEPNHEIIDFIKQNHHNYQMYIWSNNTAGLIDKALNEFELSSFFNQIASKDNVTMIKPYPYGFFNIYNGTSPLNSYLMIGNDKYSDGGGAEAVGIDFYHVDYFAA